MFPPAPQTLLACALILLCLHHSEAACKYKGKQICEGAVTNEFKKSVRICTEGKVLKKKREEVEPGYPLAGGGWYRIENSLLSLKSTVDIQSVFGTGKFSVTVL